VFELRTRGPRLAAESFQSSDEFAENAHQLYLAGRYDDALSLLLDGLSMYPHTAELHLGCGYARLAREEYAWARYAFEEALALEPNQEDALAGLGETLLKLGQRDRGLLCFDRILTLGFQEDHDLMLQVGRALFREGLFEPARRYFQFIVDAHPDSAEAAACFGYTEHRLGNDESTLEWLQRALGLDPDDAEAHIYIGNVWYDRGEYHRALSHYARTTPDDHIDELGIWRLMELKKAVYRLEQDDPELRPWIVRLKELVEEMEPEDLILAEVEAMLPDGTIRDPRQLDLFSSLLTELAGMKRRVLGEPHRVALNDGTTYTGTWDDIVLQMKQDDRDWAGASVVDYMEDMARKSKVQTGVVVPATDTESFIRGIAQAGLLQITR
jgi:tetratricopeptide (TPR) repeat protein